MSDRIVSTPGTLGGKPRIAGHRIAVQHVATWHHQMDLSVATIAEKWELDEADVIAALVYYDQHRVAIDASTEEEEALLRDYLVGQPPFPANGDGPKGMPDFDRVRADMRNNLLSDIEDYCFLFGTNALPALRDYLSRATAGWTKQPNPGLVEGV